MTIYESLAILLSCAAAVDESETASPSTLAGEGIRHVMAGDWETGMPLLKRADALVAMSGNQTYDLNAKSELTPDRIEFGRLQVARMFEDRPNMALYVHQGDIIYEWTAQRFAGATSLNRTFWSSRIPVGSGALHIPPTADRPGQIQVARRTTNRELSFEELWCRAVFELNNISRAKQFCEVDEKMVRGQISRDDYIREKFRLEFLAATMTRRFYIDVFANVLRSKQLNSDPIHWFFSDAYLGDWQRGLDYFSDRSQYPWSTYGSFYDQLSGTVDAK